MSERNLAREPDTERRILEAASRVFIQKGKLGASMQDIADEAGINRTLLHYYFRNKENLFDTVFNQVSEKVFPAIIGIMSSEKPFFERIVTLIETYSNMLKDHPYLPVFVFQEIALNPERITRAIQGKGINPLSTMKAMKADLEEIGMGGVDPRHIFASLLGMILFPYMGRPLFQEIAFEGDPLAYDKFLSDRKTQIPEFIKMAMTGAQTQKKQS